ncbi:hypothetical protein NAPIS_ORF02396 [Vairimorpha apis BRL 01]|uniref:Uncharacterized protein n=1 Tax=Vairimorpha apis BRL 01 TaxID=1037528 RepID=T0KXF0_9MICR|nr:hypothetical protein NAPIS_ORF02396 [Vairimorpha apis BRL 01]
MTSKPTRHSFNTTYNQALKYNCTIFSVNNLVYKLKFVSDGDYVNKCKDVLDVSKCKDELNIDKSEDVNKSDELNIVNDVSNVSKCEDELDVYKNDNVNNIVNDVSNVNINEVSNVNKSDDLNIVNDELHGCLHVVYMNVVGFIECCGRTEKLLMCLQYLINNF